VFLVTQLLKEDVFVYVNKIAKIVHSAVDEFGGSPNKNIGDAFLLAWRLNDRSMSPCRPAILTLLLPNPPVLTGSWVYDLGGVILKYRPTSFFAIKLFLEALCNPGS
jgi:hypothetical protein